MDAVKGNYGNYYERTLALLRQGGLVAADNVLWRGEVADPHACDADTEIMRAFNRKLHQDARVAISMATMGDGLMLACKL
jgi:predicted O-methyltransferase YrrM